MNLTMNKLARLLSEMIQFGSIIEVQPKPIRYKVRFDEHRTSGWIPANVGHAATVKNWAPLQKGEQVVVIKSFDSQGGVIVASINQAKFSQPKDNLNVHYREFPDGTWFEYDMEKKHLSGNIVGTVDLVVKEQFRLESPKIVLVGDIEHEGDIKSSGDISDKVRSMAEDRKIYNEHDHHHGNPIVGKAKPQQ